MRSIHYKGKHTKTKSMKSNEPLRLYSAIMVAYAKRLEANDEVESITCNVPLEGFEPGEYCTDFVCTKKNGEFMVRECCERRKLSLPKTAALLNASYDYWFKRGVTDWGIVIDERKDKE